MNSGVGKARNKGLSLSKGRYVYFMNPDDWVADNLLEEANKYISKYDLELFVFGNYYVSEKEEIVGESFYDGGLMDNQKLQDNFEFILSSGKLSTVWDKVFKKEYLDKYNICFPDWKNGQDGGFLFSVLKEITSIYFNKDIFYSFRRHRLGSTTSTFDEIVLSGQSINIEHFHN